MPIAASVSQRYCVTHHVPVKGNASTRVGYVRLASDLFSRGSPHEIVLHLVQGCGRRPIASQEDEMRGLYIPLRDEIRTRIKATSEAKVVNPFCHSNLFI
jgi:hypothetical protein